jgi:hypothetical protein
VCTAALQAYCTYPTLWKFPLAPPGAPTSTTTRETSSRERGTMDEKSPVILPTMATFTCRKSAIWDRRLYFPSEWRHAEDFSALKNPTASAGFEPAILDTSRPPKPLAVAFIQHAKRMRRIILWVPCPILPYFSTSSHKRHDFRETLLNIKYMCYYLYKFCMKLFLILEELSEIWWKIYIGLHVKDRLFLYDFNET